MALIGESPLFVVNIYLGQTGMYSEITYNCPNLYAILGDALQQKQVTLGMFSRTGLCLCVAALGVAAVQIIRSHREVSGQYAVLLGAWCVLCCAFFLPRMHERYAIVGELLLLCWAVCRNRPENWVCVVLNALTTLSAYSEYMFRKPFFPLQMGGLINLAVLRTSALCCFGITRLTKRSPRYDAVDSANKAKARAAFLDSCGFWRHFW